MKKLWYGIGGIIGLGAVAGTAATVVSCTNPQDNKKSTIPEDESLKGEAIWNLQDVLQDKEHYTNLWLKFDEFLDFNAGKMNAENASRYLWTGKFDARHGKDIFGTMASEKHFEDHDIVDRIKLIGDSKDSIARDEIKYAAIRMVENIETKIKKEPTSNEKIGLLYMIYNFYYHSDEENRLELATNVANSAAIFNEKYNTKLNTNLIVTIASETSFAKKLGVEFTANTLVYFSDENSDIQPHVIGKGKVVFNKFALNVDMVTNLKKVNFK